MTDYTTNPHAFVYPPTLKELKDRNDIRPEQMVIGLSQILTRRLRISEEGATVHPQQLLDTIPAILWHHSVAEGHGVAGGSIPSDFVRQLLATMSIANTMQMMRLERGFPIQAYLMSVVRSDKGVWTLQRALGIV